MKKNNRLGFTLIELVIYLGITMTLLLLLMELLAAIFSAQLTSNATSAVASDGRYIYTRLIYDINRAESVSIPANLGDTSQTLEATVNGNQIVYSIINGNLTITDQQDTNTLNSIDTNISNVSFKRVGNANGKHTFQIKYTISSNIQDNGTQEVKSFQTTAGLR